MIDLYEFDLSEPISSPVFIFLMNVVEKITIFVIMKNMLFHWNNIFVIHYIFVALVEIHILIQFC